MVDRSAEGSGDAATVLSGVVIVLAVLLVVMRLYTRYFTRAGMWWDDWFILLGVVSAVVTGVLVVWATTVDPDGDWVTSNADPTYVYTPANIFHLKLSFVASILYFTIASATKVSICLMYLRLFSVSPVLRRQIWVTTALVVSWWISCTVATLTNCMPLKWSWLNSLSDARYCFNYNIFWMASGVIEAVIDAIIIILPVKAVLGLGLSPRKKITVALVFLLGTFVLVTGTIKVILGYIPGSRVPSYIRTEVWTVVHVGMAIVCACLPVCWPLFVRTSKFIRRSGSKASLLTKRLYDSVGSADKDESRQRHSIPEMQESNKVPTLDVEERGTESPLRQTADWPGLRGVAGGNIDEAPRRHGDPEIRY